ncbi:MAG: DUF2269 domain-containing protein [Pseudomonadota bacterium]
MLLADFLRWAHVLGATVLIGTGAGIAFFMLMAHRTREPKLIAHTAGIVVIADWIFTASAVIIQPITGVWLAYLIGWPIFSGWVFISLLLYVFIGVFWLPVVWIQKEMRDLARAASASNAALPQRYDRLFRIWFACGFPAFAAILVILWLMLMKPVI